MGISPAIGEVWRAVSNRFGELHECCARRGEPNLAQLSRAAFGAGGPPWRDVTMAAMHYVG